MKFRNYTIYKFCVLSIFAFIKQKTDKSNFRNTII